jgi:hypothetical protein
LMTNFFLTATLALFAWLFFWTNYNLIESYFLTQIGEQKKREYGAASYGIVSSVTLFLWMFLTHQIELQVWFNWVFYIWGSIILIIWILFHTKRKLLN